MKKSLSHHLDQARAAGVRHATPPVPEQPAGFATSIREARSLQSGSASASLLLCHKASLAGLGAAAAIAMVVSLTTEHAAVPMKQESFPGDPWLNMPMLTTLPE